MLKIAKIKIMKKSLKKFEYFLQFKTKLVL